MTERLIDAERTKRRNTFAETTLRSAHESGLDGADITAATLNLLAAIFSSTARGDAARYAAIVEETVRRLLDHPSAPQPISRVDPGRLLSDQELEAAEALIRAAIQWTDTGNAAKVMSTFGLIMGELRRLRRVGAI